MPANGTVANAKHEEVLASVKDIPWLPTPNLAKWIRADKMPTDGPITGSYVISKHDAEVLIALHRKRGWDLTGGHIDEGETPEQAASREALEETGVRVENLRLFAIQRLFIEGPKPEGYTYPYPLSYQTLYLADIDEVGEFAEEEDSIARLIEPCAAALRRVKWIKDAPVLYEALLVSLNSET